MIELQRADSEENFHDNRTDEQKLGGSFSGEKARQMDSDEEEESGGKTIVLVSAIIEPVPLTDGCVDKVHF